MISTIQHQIKSISFVNNIMIVNFDNEKLEVQLEKVSKKLLNASEAARNDFEISPSGYGVHWRQLDEDLSLNGFLNQK